MKILESQAQFDLSVVLTATETLLYSEVFRHKLALKIPELDNRKYVILKMDPHHGEGMPENSWRLVVKQEKVIRMTDPTTSNALDDASSQKNGANNKP